MNRTQHPATHDTHTVVAVLMGVSGVGKTTVGKAVCRRLGWDFFDADHFHPEANVEKMRQGIPLDDHDRAGWLEALTDLIARLLVENRSSVLACSALKQSYRERLLSTNAGAIIVYLKAERDVVANRIKGRSGHYFEAGLLDSQYEALEEPSDAVTVDATMPTGDVVDAVVGQLQRMTTG